MPHRDVDEQIATLVSMQNEIAERQYELSQLVDSEKQQKKKVAVAVKEELVTMTIGVGRDWLNAMYWKDSDLATPVRNAYKEAFGGAFSPTPQNKEIQCRVCKSDAVVLCTSWTNYKEKGKSNYLGYTCDECLVKEKAKQKNQIALSFERSEQEQVEEIVTSEASEVWLVKKQVKKDQIAYLRNLPYKEYLLTEHWQRFRKDALKRAKYCCQLCNNADKLHVHHRTYKNLGDEDISDVIVLCCECHEKHHDIKPKELIQ